MTPQQINKMKVTELRRLVVDNNIFRGGLSGMKKASILDKIYQSQWWKEETGEIVLTEKEKLQKKLHELEKKLQEEVQREADSVQKSVEEPQPEPQPDPEPQPEPEQVEPQEPEVKEPVPEPQVSENIQQLILEALQQQRNDMMKRLFG
jgi:hypothetical protein